MKNNNLRTQIKKVLYETTMSTSEIEQVKGQATAAFENLSTAEKFKWRKAMKQCAKELGYEKKLFWQRFGNKFFITWIVGSIIIGAPVIAIMGMFGMVSYKKDELKQQWLKEIIECVKNKKAEFDKMNITDLYNDSEGTDNSGIMSSGSDMSMNESNIKRILRSAIQEQEKERYMFFSNLQQMRRQCGLLLNMNEDMVEKILSDGHDWAQDHIAEAKNNLDQVFDFLMNESKKSGMELSMDVEDKDMIGEGKKKSGTKLCARGKAAAKSKFKVYPSAYANGFAVQVCKGRMPGLDGKKKCSSPYC